jgi:multiple sugar transport system substrate-binding protein
MIRRDQFDLADFYDHTLQNHKWGGKHVGLPYNWTVITWFFNEELFRRQGVKTPYEHWKAGTWHWDQYMDLAHGFRRLGEDLYGTSNVPAQNTNIGFPFVWSNDGDVYDKDYTKALFDQAPAMQTWEFMHRASQLAPKGDATKTSTPEAGKVAMWFDWLPNYFLYRTQYVTEMQFTYGIVPPPAAPKTRKSVFTSNSPGWGIVKDSQHQEESWALIKQFVSADGMRRTYREAASPPARRSLAASRDFWRSHPDLPDAAIMLELAEARARSAHVQPRLSNFADLQAVLAEEFGAAWADKQSVRDAALKSAQRATRLLADGQVDR